MLLVLAILGKYYRENWLSVDGQAGKLPTTAYQSAAGDDNTQQVARGLARTT